MPTYGRRRRISLGVDWSSVAAMTAVAHAPNSQNDKSYFFFNGRARAAHYLHGLFMLERNKASKNKRQPPLGWALAYFVLSLVLFFFLRKGIKHCVVFSH